MCQWSLTWDVLLWVDQVLVQGILAPNDALVDVGLGVLEAWLLTSLSAEKSIQIGTSLVLATSLDRVALRAASHEDFLSCFNVAHVCAFE